MTPDEPESEHAWDAGWEGHRRAQQQRLARLSFMEKLQWLEEAHELVRHLARGPVDGSRPPLIRDANRTPTDD